MNDWVNTTLSTTAINRFLRLSVFLMTTACWNAVDLANWHERQDAIRFVRKVMERAGDYHLYHDLDRTLRSEPGDQPLVAFKLDQGDGILGILLLSCRDQPLRLQLGERTNDQRTLSRYNLWSGPLIAGVSKGDDAWRNIILALLQTIKSHLTPSFEAISIEGVPIDDPLYQLLRCDPGISSDYLLIEQGHSLIHHFIDLPGTLDDYLEQLDEVTIRNLAYRKRRLLRDFADDVEIVRYEHQDDVESFLDHAGEISKKTDQPHPSGLGSNGRMTLKQRLDFAAKQAWLRSYIMFCSGRPVAVMLGYQYQDCFYQSGVSIDPDYTKWSVLSALKLEVLEDLYARGRRPKTVDCSIDHGDQTTRFANREQIEADLLLLPRTVRHAMLAGAYRRLDGLAKLTVATADRIGVKQALKKTVRTLAFSKISGSHL